MEKLGIIIANNLTYLRKNAKLTQLEFGEKFNYSDKTVSKWELGSVIPSVEILKEIADFYGVSVDYILTEHRNQAEYETEIARPVNPKDKLLFIGLVVTIAWCIAAVIYAVGFMRNDTRYWVAFLYAVPASFISMTYLVRKYFRKSMWSLIFMSAFVWTLLIAIIVHEFILGANFWFLIIVGIPIQACIVLLMIKKRAENK